MNKGIYSVIELLKNLSKKEQSGLKAFAACAFFNQDGKVSTLLNTFLNFINSNIIVDECVLLSLHSELSEVSAKKSNLARRSYIYAKMSLLLKLTQQFVTIIALQKCEKTKADLLQQQLLERKQYRTYKKFIKSQKNTLKATLKDAEHYEYQYIIENSALSYAQHSGNLAKQNNIGIVKDSLTQYYLLQQMDFYLVELSFAESSIAHQINTSTFDAIQPLLNLPQFSGHPLFKVYLSVIKMLKEKTKDAFFQLQSDLESYYSEIPIGSLKNFYNSMCNFCSFQFRNGKIEFIRYQFDIYKIMEEKNLLFTDDQIHISNLHNIITVSCNVNKFDWATKMLDKYYAFLPIHLCDAVKNYHQGAIAYYKKDYQLAIDYLLPLPTINLSHDVNRRSIMIKAFYELNVDYKETTHTLFRSFEKYVGEQKKLSKKSKISFKNFIRTLINLYRIKHQATKMQLPNVKQKLLAQQLNSNKSWLLEKVKELENRQFIYVER